MQIRQSVGQDRVHLGVISNDEKVISRIRAIGSEFKYSITFWKDLSEFMLSKEACVMLIAAPPSGVTTGDQIAEYVQVGRMKSNDTYIVCLTPSILDKDEAGFLKRSGVNLVLLQKELFETGKLEFACTQVIRSSYLPIKAFDLLPGTEVPFDLYHLMPQRNKFVRFLFLGDTLTRDRFEKMAQVGEIYISRDSSERFESYVDRYRNQLKTGLAARCRAQFLRLYVSYSNLVFLLSDQSEHGSYAQGQTLLKHCRDLAGALLTSLAEVQNAAEVVNNAAIGEFGSIERSPAVSAYAGILGLQMGVPNVEEIMTAALFANIGMVTLSPEIIKKIRANKFNELSVEEKKLYETYPIASVNLVLGRKLALEEGVRRIILAVNERADGTGFPNRLSGLKIPEGSQLISFSTEFDNRTVLKMGQARVNHSELCKTMIREAAEISGRYSPIFAEKMKKVSI